MAPAPVTSPDETAFAPTPDPRRGRRFAAGRVAVLLAVTLLAALVIGWFERERIARDLIGQELAKLGIPATYEVERLDTGGQIVTDVVIGNAGAPDLTIERIAIRLDFGFGVPQIAGVTVTRPRLYGTYRDGELSFGTLDTVLFGEGDGALPGFELSVRDGRARIDSAFGDIGVKIDGEGRLDRSFAGTLAAVAPDLTLGECDANGASAYGAFTFAPDRFALDGPLRLARLSCGGSGFAANRLAWQARSSIDLDNTAIRMRGRMEGGRLEGAGVSARSFAGPVTLGFAKDRLTADVDLTATDPRSDIARAATVDLTGVLRADADFVQVQSDIEFAAAGIVPARSLAEAIRPGAEAAKGTLAAPLLARLSRGLARAVPGSRLRASASINRAADGLTMVIPDAVLRDATGATLLSFSRLRYSQSRAGSPDIAGNFRLTGRDLPQMVGRMEQDARGDIAFRLKMREYAADDSRLAIPELRVRRTAGGYSFDGTTIASGPLPGGSARNLRLPITGIYRDGGALELWSRCADVSFDTLSYANLRLDRRAVTLCPAPGRPIVRYADGRLSIAAGAPSLALAGTLGGTRIAVRSGPVGFAYPGQASARDLTVTLGPGDGAARFQIAGLRADFRNGVRGTFENADIGIAAVPLALGETQGRWRYEGGALSIGGASFTLSDTDEDARFVPLPATGGQLRLANDVITASASLLAPTDRRALTDVDIVHNLATGTGYADLDVPGLRFDKSLQPDMITPLLLGVVANVDGTVTGTGRIDWNPAGVTSSGQFASNSLDLAAAFGPVKGASGTVRFTDLLSLTTAPDQRIAVASINPGIEVENGSVAFSLRDGQFLGVTGGTWPFMGGTLYLRPVELNLGIAERRRYLLEVEGLDAALFVEDLELGNIAATGVFDGAMPLVFDERGFGRIEGGRLVSRAPGGNVSYVGELTYEDLSPIANYAFQTLRSLDYDRMQITVDGPLTGDILTRLQFDGVTQGPGTSSNFITRQIARLPIRFNVNIRAPFYKLMGSLRSIYDPAAVRDPRELGLLGDDGTRFVPVTPEMSDPDVQLPRDPREPVQTPESEEMR